MPIILIIFIYYNELSEEPFDEKINRTPYDKCGTICTKVFGCKGFSADKNGTCYLSKTPILGNPNGSIFGYEYNKNNLICNKLGEINDPVIATPIDFRKNSTYICTEGKSGQEEKTFRNYVNNKIILPKIDNLGKLDIDKYTFEDIKWGEEIYLDDHKDLIQNPQKDNSIILMNEYDSEFLGQYMFPHKCSANISKKDCLKQCLNDKSCVGTEWNLVYLKQNNDKYDMYNGICCPKIKITEIIPRRDEFKFGKFYLKDVVIKENENTDDIYIALNRKT